jgi:glycosyltransferase involved in cell wall biosynthesis
MGPAESPSRPAPAAGRPLGVVMLLRWNGVGGTQRQALRLSAELRSLGVIPFVLTRRRGGLPRRDVVDDVGVYRVGWPLTGGLRAVAFLGGALVWMLRHRQAFTVIHAHNLPTALTAALLRPLLRKPVVVKLPNAVCIEDFGRRRFGALRWLVLRRYVTRFVALNDEIERCLTDHGVAANRIVRIPNGVEPPNGHRSRDTASIKRSLGLASDGRTVIYLGRLIPDKGIAWLLDVWKNVVREEPACHLLIAGEGPDGQRLRALAHDLGITETMSFLGSRDDVDRLLSIADLLVLPSRSEGMSNALLEAMSGGVAVVATDVPGNRALIEDQKDGVLVTYGDSAALTQALLTLLRDASLRERFGREASHKVVSVFSLHAVARTYRGMYRELVRGAGA